MWGSYLKLYQVTVSYQRLLRSRALHYTLGHEFFTVPHRRRIHMPRTQAQYAMHPDFRLMLEILGLVAASIVAILSYTIDTFFVHKIVQGLLHWAISVLIVECWLLIRKITILKRPHLLPKWVVVLSVVHLLVIPALLLYHYVLVLYVTGALIWDSILVCCEPDLIVWIVICYALLRAYILTIKLAKLFILRLRTSADR